MTCGGEERKSGVRGVGVITLTVGVGVGVGAGCVERSSEVWGGDAQALGSQMEGPSGALPT